MGCGVSAPALLGEFESRYAKLIVSDRSATVVAKRFLESVVTVMFRDTRSEDPEMLNEEVVLVDNTRVGVYKGDQVHISTADKMQQVQKLDSMENGLELHIVLQPQFDLPERFVVSWDSEQCQYSIRHEDPLRVAELNKQVTLSTDGGWCSTSPSASTTSPDSSRGVDFYRDNNGNRINKKVDYFEVEYTPEESPNSVPSPKQIHNARLYRRLSEELELQSVTTSMKRQVTPSDYLGEDSPEESKPQRPVLQRRHSVAGHEFPTTSTDMNSQQPRTVDGVASPTRHRRRRHSVSGAEGSSQQNLMQQLDASLSPKSPQLRRSPSVDALLSPKYSQQQRRPSLSEVRRMPLDVMFESSPYQRRNSDPSIQTPDGIGRFAKVDVQQPPRRRSIS